VRRLRRNPTLIHVIRLISGLLARAQRKPGGYHQPTGDQRDAILLPSFLSIRSLSNQSLNVSLMLHPSKKLRFSPMRRKRRLFLAA
jgi:hypothetical protein